MLILAIIPLIPFYFFLKPLREYASQLIFLGPFLLVTAFFLFLGERFQLRQRSPDSFKNAAQDALWIGAMQSVALIPGISRSAATISTARFLGWDPSEAVRFSFLLSIPTILGGNCLELLKLFLFSESPAPFELTSSLIGFLSSLVGGALVVGPAFSLLEKGRSRPFILYCSLLGIVCLLFFTIKSHG